MTAQLAVLQSPRSGLTGGTRAQMRVHDGNVSGYLALARYDRRARTALYALRVENDSPEPLRALVQFARRQAIVDALPGYVDVAPFSIKESLLPVALAETGRFDRAIVEVHGTACRLSMEAAAPRKRGNALSVIASCGAALACIAAAALGAAMATPRITALDVPARASDVASVDVPYVAAGIGTLRYEALEADGTRVAAGILSDRAGSIKLRPYAGETVRLSLEGPFGSVQRVARIDRVVSARRPAAAAAHRTIDADAQPLIGEFSIAPSAPRAGDLVRVEVATRAPQSELWLVDLGGTLWARQAVNVGGPTYLRIPANAGGRAMRLVVHAADAKNQAASAIGLVVLPRPQQSANRVAAAPQAVTALSFALARPTATSGEAVIALVKGKHDDAHVTLTDQAGTVLAQGDIAAGEDALSLVAPSVKAPAHYFVVANVTSGTATQSFVRRLNVVP